MIDDQQIEMSRMCLAKRMDNMEIPIFLALHKLDPGSQSIYVKIFVK